MSRPPVGLADRAVLPTCAALAAARSLHWWLRMKRAVPMFLFSLLLSLGACASDDSCEGDNCELDAPDDLGRDDTSGTLDAPSPLHCRAACDVLMDSCSPGEVDDKPREGTAECVEWCASGGLSREEAACLASVGCSGDAQECLAE
jgi:hypothetical protein